MKNNIQDKGALVISLDFEKYWGMRDKKTIEDYRENLANVDKVVDRTLGLFEKYEVRATWAVVGFLFYKGFEALKDDLPVFRPNYVNKKLDPYHYIDQIEKDLVTSEYHFSLDAIQRVAGTLGQELATHTHSHLYFLEEGIEEQAILEDLNLAKQHLEGIGHSMDSIVFPRNQYNDLTLDMLKKAGVRSYRGNEESWLYKSTKDEKHTPVRRAVRLIDSMVNISGHHSSIPREINGLVNVPSSRLLRAFNDGFQFINTLQLRRIKKSMKYAARKGQVFHLWWHPHNFGVNMDQNFLRLESILSYYAELKEDYGFRSLNMRDFLG